MEEKKKRSWKGRSVGYFSFRMPMKSNLSCSVLKAKGGGAGGGKLFHEERLSRCSLALPISYFTPFGYQTISSRRSMLRSLAVFCGLLPAIQSCKRWSFTTTCSVLSPPFPSTLPTRRKAGMGTAAATEGVGAGVVVPSNLTSILTSLASSSFSSVVSSLWNPHKIMKLQALANDVFSRGNVHLKNVKHLTALPEGLHSFPEVCFIGKPNVGKSSIISCLLHNGVLGRGGKFPGTTRLLKFFNVGDAIALVDTPGYGGWKTKKNTPTRRRQRLPAERAQGFAILFRYLALRHRGEGLKHVYWVMEANAGPTCMRFQPRDEEILTFLQREGIPFSVILSKIDRHWRYYQECHSPEKKKCKNQFQVDKKGIPQLSFGSPTFPLDLYSKSAENRESVVEGSCDDVNQQNPYSFFEEGVRRNMKEIYDFLKTDKVPILGVSANRYQPQRCLYIDSLRYDLTYHCVSNLPEELWEYKNIHALSYAPPTADDLQDVQLKYPVESFVVPKDNNLSLAEMVRRHERGKARLLQRHGGSMLPYYSSVAFPQPVEEFVLPLLSGRMGVKGKEGKALSQGRRGERVESMMRKEEVIPPSFLALPPPPVETSLPEQNTEKVKKDMLSFHPLDLRDKRERGVVAETTNESLPSVSSKFNALNPTSSSDSSAVRNDLFLATMDKAAGVLQGKIGCVGVVPPSPSGFDSAPTSFKAINGVSIPSTLVPACVEEVMKSESDEIQRFAMHSEAGGFETLLAQEYLWDSDPERCTAFLERTREGKVLAGLERNSSGNEEYLFYGGSSPSLCSARQRSAKKKRDEALLKKYLDHHRKERSVYLSAEGYMCPWLSVSGGMGGGGGCRSSVVGLGEMKGIGRSGATMHALKKKGFGGKSYSAFTMKHRGRATKKTGFWAT